MKSLILYILFIILPISVVSQEFFLAEQNNKYGYLDMDGNVQIPFEYSFAFTETFTCIAFVAQEDGRIIAIDRFNNQLFAVFNYDNGPDNISEGLFRIIDDYTKLMGFADINGNIIISPSYKFIKSFSNGLAAFNYRGKYTIDTTGVDRHELILGGKWGYIDKDKNEIFPPIFDEINEFVDNRAEARVGEHKFFIYCLQDKTKHNNTDKRTYLLIEDNK